MLAAEVLRSTLTVYSEALGQLVRSLSAGRMITGMDADSTVTCMTPQESFKSKQTSCECSKT